MITVTKAFFRSVFLIPVGGSFIHESFIPKRFSCRTSVLFALGCVIGGCFGSVANAQDTVEFLSGAKTRGKVVEIRAKERQVVFESKIADRTVKRTYSYSKIHAVTYKGKRYVLTKKDEASANHKMLRSEKEVNKLIEQVGSTPPDWYDDTPLEYPDTLDLDWPQPTPKGWNNRKNVGQYIWDIINPNASKWRSGVRFMHHLLVVHKDDPKTTNRIMRSLGSMYFRFFQDYPRAAFWWRKSKVSPSSQDGISLAECYFRLGNKKMALDAIDRRRLRVETVKLLGNMGKTKEALQVADKYVELVKEPQWALLAAGDACRLAGQYKKAISYYQRVVDSADMKNESYDKRAKNRALQSIEAIEQFELLDIAKIDDGTYSAETLAYEGPLSVEVTVKSGKIQQVEITKHKEKQYYSAIRDIPEQIIAKQSVKDVDATSRATITAEAIVSATAKALASQAATGDN